MFLRFNKLEQLEFILKKLLGFRNMQEKLGNYYCLPSHTISAEIILDMTFKKLTYKGQYIENEINAVLFAI